MACHVLFLKNKKEFFDLLRERDPDLILKMVKCILNAIRHKRERVEIFNVVFKDTSEMAFNVDEDQYLTVLGNCLHDLEMMEEYELCADVKKIIDKGPRKRRKRKTVETIQ